MLLREIFQKISKTAAAYLVGGIAIIQLAPVFFNTFPPEKFLGLAFIKSRIAAMNANLSVSTHKMASPVEYLQLFLIVKPFLMQGQYCAKEDWFGSIKQFLERALDHRPQS